MLNKTSALIGKQEISFTDTNKTVEVECHLVELEDNIWQGYITNFYESDFSKEELKELHRQVYAELYYHKDNFSRKPLIFKTKSVEKDKTGFPIWITYNPSGSICSFDTIKPSSKVDQYGNPWIKMMPNGFD